MRTASVTAPTPPRIHTYTPSCIRTFRRSCNNNSSNKLLPLRCTLPPHPRRAAHSARLAVDSIISPSKVSNSLGTKVPCGVRQFLCPSHDTCIPNTISKFRSACSNSAGEHIKNTNLRFISSISQLVSFYSRKLNPLSILCYLYFFSFSPALILRISSPCDHATCPPIITPFDSITPFRLHLFCNRRVPCSRRSSMEETSQGVIQLLVHLGTILIMMHHYCVGRVPFSVHERSSHCFFFRELALLSFNFTFGFPSRVPCPSRFLHPHPLTVNAASVCPEFILIGESLIWPPAVILVRHC